MDGMESGSKCSPEYRLRKTSAMRCTAASSNLGGACSAHLVAAAWGEVPDAADEALPQALVRALHLSSALRRRATGVQCSGSEICSVSHRLWGCFAMKFARSSVLLYAYAKSEVAVTPVSRIAPCSASGTWSSVSSATNASCSGS